MNPPHEPFDRNTGQSDRGRRATARDRVERAVKHRFVAKLEKSAALRYALAPVCIAIAVLLNLSAIGPFLHPTGLFLAGIVAAAWFGGVGPGFLAALLAALVLPSLVPRLYPLILDFFDLPRFLTFAMTALAVGWGTTFRRRAEAALRQSEHELRASRNELEMRVAKRTADLRFSEERYARAMDASNDGLWEWNPMTDELFVSPRAKQLLGVPDGVEIRRRADLRAHGGFHPEDRRRIGDTFRACLAPGFGGLDIEYRVINPAGELRWVRSRGKVFPGSLGQQMLLTGSLTDITERKLAADALRESEARSRSLSELSSDWYWKQDENLRFTYLSNEVFDRAGHSAESSIGKTRWELKSITPLSCSWPEHQALLDARQPFRDLEYCRLGQDGRPRYISVSGAPIFDDRGSFKGYQGLGRDISERKRIEGELRARQDMLDLAQQAARAVAFEWRIGAGEGENRWSPDLEAMYGIPPGSYDGTYESWKKLVYPEDWPKVRAAIKAAGESGDVAAEYRVVHKGGTIRWLQAKGRMFLDPERKPVRVVGFMLDVTDRRQAEDELRRMERQLRQVQRLEAMGTLAGGIAHDFNNLLGAILGYGEMAMRDAPAGSRLRRDLDSIMVAGERGRALVDRILAFSRSGVGERVAVHVEDVVRETLELFASNLSDDIVIEEQLHAGRAAVMGDATQIHQVLMNLVTNSAQAMPAGGTLRVSLECTRIDAPRAATTGAIFVGDHVVLKIADTGSGVPPEILERIFDPFFTTKEVGVGTGLGLSLVHGIVTGLGGVIDVATTVGKGSVFTVYLPRAGDISDASPATKPAQPASRQGDREQILIVDDEESLVTLATETLTELGYSPIGYTASAAAFEAFSADPMRFDAMITDESMPGMSGSELIRKVRKIRPAIPILLVSGYLGTAVVRRAREAGADAVLKKPLSARELASSLEHLLRETEDARSQRSGASIPHRPESKGRRRTAATRLAARSTRAR